MRRISSSDEGLSLRVRIGRMGDRPRSTANKSEQVEYKALADAMAEDYKELIGRDYIEASQ